jgi:hypothetical protein
MTKKLLATVTFALATAFTSTAAFADQIAQPTAAKAPVMVADRRGNDVDVLDAQRAMGRAGTVTLSARGGRNADLAVVSSDPRLDLARVMIQYAGGKTVMLRSNGASRIDLPDRGRIASIRVQYVNRGAGRGAIVKLIARDDDRGGRDDDRGGWNGRGRGRH